MFYATTLQLNAIRSKIQAARTAHGAWEAGLHRLFACGLAPSEADVAADPHQRCAFGQWLYHRNNDKLRDLPSFVELAQLHERLHNTARDILRRRKASGRVAETDYDLLVDEIDRFNTALSALDAKIAHTEQTIDALTGAINHAQMLADLQEAQQHQDGKPYSLLRIDIDVKEVNQHHGHKSGNLLLQRCVEQMSALLDGNGQIYRYNGAEFIICRPHTDDQQARHLMQALLAEIATAAREVIPNSSGELRIHQGITQLTDEPDIERQLDQGCILSPHNCPLDPPPNSDAYDDKAQYEP